MNEKLRIALACLIGIVIGIIIGVFLAAVGTSQYNNDLVPLEKYKWNFNAQWACMDGCSNMQEQIFTYTVDNQSMKTLHDKCSNRCWSQYMNQTDAQ